MVLLAGGGALLSKKKKQWWSPEPWHVRRFPWTLNLNRCYNNVYKNHRHTEKAQGSLQSKPCALESWRNWTWFNSVYLLHAKLYARLPKLGYLAAFCEWSSPRDSMVPTVVPYLQEECRLGLGASTSQGRVILDGSHWPKGNRWGDILPSCFKQTGTPTLSSGVKAGKTWSRCAVGSSPRHFDRGAFQTI